MVEKVTSSQVAKRAGVSQSAVSRFYTPGASVSAKTAAKVRIAATELGYRPNILARAMVSGKSRIIGLVVAYMENYFYTEALEKLSNAFQERGYHVLIFMASQTAGNVSSVVEEILDYQVDGIVMASVALSSEVGSRCQAAGVPVVLFNRSQDMQDISSITSNNFEGGRKAARLLIDLGHKKIGYIAGWEGASTQRDREAGFNKEIVDSGWSVFSRTVGNFRAEKTRVATFEMFDKPKAKRPDAVFVANDHMGFIVMDILRYELDLRIPDDVSVIGYDDVPPAAWKSYDLTTVRQRANLMVQETVHTILNQIENPNSTKPTKLQIESPLIIRSSTRNKPN